MSRIAPAVMQTPRGAARSCLGGISSMENNPQGIKSISSPRMTRIEELKKLLSQKAANVPKYDPFTVAGNQAWEEWAEECREIERQLEAEGVEL
ncbi:MAG TPA: hypothetical protein VN368_01335 [Candidatus Methylomirabilis sp.]|nr:hypothetical protein [Candidatus Methylomirabilis sp.]